jgi:nucleotidyltransferase substrate binding protein (TIGR01987 family)
MDTTRLLERSQDYLKAVQRLQEACAQPYTDYMRDCVIQRFEFCWELAWKMLKLRLEQLGIEASNPRDTFKEALNKGLIHDGNAWSDAQKNRNLASHTYDEVLAQTVYQFITVTGLALFQALALDAAKWPNDK